MADRFEICVENIGLHPFSRSRSFLPTLIQDRSAPQTWSIEPALPSFLAFDTTSGRISQTTTTQNLPATSPTKYEISVTNGVGTAPPPASFAIEVDMPPPTHGAPSFPQFFFSRKRVTCTSWLLC